MASTNTLGFNPLADPKTWKLLQDLDENTIASIKWFKAIDKRLWYCTHDDRLFGRGRNDWGQLGIGHRENVDTPTPVVGLEGQQVVDIVGSEGMTLVLTQHGRVYVWGANDQKQLEDSRELCITRPKHMESLNDIVSIACGRLHAMVLDKHGKMFIWGSNKHGQIGNDKKGTQSDPIKLDKFTAERIKQIECGARNSMVLLNNGDVWAWGWLFVRNHPRTPVQLEVPNQVVEQIACAHNALVSLTKQGQIFIHRGNVTPQLIQPQDIQFTSVIIIDYNKFGTGNEGLVLANSATHQVYHASVKKEGDIQLTDPSLFPPDVIIQYSKVQVSPFKMTVTDSNLSNEDDDTFTLHDLMIIYSLADKYDQGKLKDKCVRLLSDLLNVDNCCKLYELSVKYCLEHFKEQVIEFARNNYEHIPPDSFTQISPDNSDNFLDMILR